MRKAVSKTGTKKYFNDPLPKRDTKRDNNNQEAIQPNPTLSLRTTRFSTLEKHAHILQLSVPENLFYRQIN